MELANVADAMEPLLLLQFVQAVLEPFTDQVWGALAVLHTWKLDAERYLDCETDSPFMFVNRPKTAVGGDGRLCDPESADAFDKLVLYHRVCDWIAVVSIACPWAVSEELNWGIVQDRLADGYLVHIHRELVRVGALYLFHV
jgi:hypothetical protein